MLVIIPANIFIAIVNLGHKAAANLTPTSFGSEAKRHKLKIWQENSFLLERPQLGRGQAESPTDAGRLDYLSWFLCHRPDAQLWQFANLQRVGVETILISGPQGAEACFANVAKKKEKNL